MTAAESSPGSMLAEAMSCLAKSWWAMRCVEAARDRVVTLVR